MSPGATSWASQILSNSDFGMSLAPAQAGADHCQQDGLVGSVVFEVVGQIGVEGHCVARPELVALPVAVQFDLAALHERRLPAARLVHRRISGPAGNSP